MKPKKLRTKFPTLPENGAPIDYPEDTDHTAQVAMFATAALTGDFEDVWAARESGLLAIHDGGKRASILPWRVVMAAAIYAAQKSAGFRARLLRELQAINEKGV